MKSLNELDLGIKTVKKRDESLAFFTVFNIDDLNEIKKSGAILPQIFAD